MELTNAYFKALIHAKEGAENISEPVFSRTVFTKN